MAKGLCGKTIKMGRKKERQSTKRQRGKKKDRNLEGRKERKFMCEPRRKKMYHTGRCSQLSSADLKYDKHSQLQDSELEGRKEFSGSYMYFLIIISCFLQRSAKNEQRGPMMHLLNFSVVKCKLSTKRIELMTYQEHFLFPEQV